MPKRKNKNSPLTGSERVTKSHNKKLDAGLREIKILVADEREVNLPPGVKSEAEKLREYAKKQPKTKRILRKLKNG